MQLLVLVLNQVDKLDELLKAFVNEGITGATIINSTGMIKELAGHMEYQPIFGSHWFNIDHDRKKANFFMALSEEQVKKPDKSFVRLSATCLNPIREFCLLYLLFLQKGLRNRIWTLQPCFICL